MPFSSQAKKAAASPRKSPSVARAIKTRFGQAAYEAYKQNGTIPAGFDTPDAKKPPAKTPSKAAPKRVKPAPKNQLQEGVRIESSNSRRPGRILRYKPLKDGSAAYMIKWDEGGIGTLTPDRIIVMTTPKGVSATPDSTNAEAHYARMQEIGIKVDLPGIKAKITQINTATQALKSRLALLTGNPKFNPNSKTDINAYLATQGRPPLQSVNEQAIKDAGLGEVGKLIKETKQSAKQAQDLGQILKRTGDDGRIHPSWTEAATGRWYTGDPPIQTLGAIVRDYLVPDEGNAFITIDWHQQELRIIAEASGDPYLKATFENGGDPHVLAYERVTGKKQSTDPAAAKKERDLGKMLNYALTYGLGPESLATRIGVTPDKAAGLIDAYFNAFPAVARWIKGRQQQGVKDGFITTLGGRKIPIDTSIGDPDGKAGRQAVNYDIQGSGADQLVALLDSIAKDDPERSDMIRATIHDALLVEVPRSDVAKLKAYFEAKMREPFFGVQPDVDSKGPSPSWSHATEFDDLDDIPESIESADLVA